MTPVFPRISRPVLASIAAAIAAAVAGPPAAADVAPGDVVRGADKERIRGLIPDELFPYVAEDFPDLEMKIVASGDYTPHPKYVEATVKYACQATVDERGLLQNYTAGQPFPFSECA